MLSNLRFHLVTKTLPRTLITPRTLKTLLRTLITQMNLTKIFRKVEITEELGKQTSETKKSWKLSFNFLDFVIQFFSFPLCISPFPICIVGYISLSYVEHNKMNSRLIIHNAFREIFQKKLFKKVSRNYLYNLFFPDNFLRLFQLQ